MGSQTTGTAVALGLALGGCTGGLPAEGREARAELVAALDDRQAVDVEAVSRAARSAARWKGQDALLDVVLGDALANVLMRPGEGLALLRAHPDPSDPRWQAAMGGAALRTGTSAAVHAVQHEAQLSPVDAEAPGVSWLAARALRDPSLGWAALVELDADCRLLDGQPERGRRPLDVPVPERLLATAAEAATRVVLGRGPRPTDDPPETGRGLAPCRTGRLLGEALPSPMLRHVVLAAEGPAPPVAPALYLSLGWGPSREPWVLGSTRPEAAASLIEAALGSEPAAVPAGDRP
jgi:hypothetical protein